jgi:hypothetical protein
MTTLKPHLEFAPVDLTTGWEVPDGRTLRHVYEVAALPVVA